MLLPQIATARFVLPKNNVRRPPITGLCLTKSSLVDSSLVIRTCRRYIVGKVLMFRHHQQVTAHTALCQYPISLLTRGSKLAIRLSR
ncbi:hypothetical protein J1614_000275 [Plenodomus biglobosus]|nr:hypothetical protein J1614_000275 [Plenodomus biglobosus]